MINSKYSLLKICALLIFVIIIKSNLIIFKNFGLHTHTHTHTHTHRVKRGIHFL